MKVAVTWLDCVLSLLNPSVGHNTTFQLRGKGMYQYLRLTVLIMLIALTLTPTLVFAARCSDCGGDAHHDPNNCVKYAHASDCPCSECADTSGSGSSGGSSFWEGTKHFLNKIPVVGDLIAVLTVNFDPNVNRQQEEIVRESGGYMGNTYNGVAEQSQ